MNIENRLFKEATLKVFSELGGWSAYLAWAKKNKDDFYKYICTRLLPMEMQVKGNLPMAVQIVRFADAQIASPKEIALPAHQPAQIEYDSKTPE